MTVNDVSDVSNCCRHAIYVWEGSRCCFRHNSLSVPLLGYLNHSIIHKWNEFVISLELFIMLPVILQICSVELQSTYWSILSSVFGPEPSKSLDLVPVMTGICQNLASTLSCLQSVLYLPRKWRNIQLVQSVQGNICISLMWYLLAMHTSCLHIVFTHLSNLLI